MVKILVKCIICGLDMPVQFVTWIWDGIRLLATCWGDYDTIHDEIEQKYGFCTNETAVAVKKCILENAKFIPKTRRDR